LQLTFTAPPKSFRVLHLGKSIWNEAAPSAEMERKMTMEFPKEGIDLKFEAEFPAGTARSAARLRLTDPDGNELEKSVWGAETIDEVVTFP
jgi:hypothetical protein